MQANKPEKETNMEGAMAAKDYKPHDKDYKETRDGHGFVPKKV